VGARSAATLTTTQSVKSRLAKQISAWQVFNVVDAN
jgi:hypothetical protein